MTTLIPTASACHTLQLPPTEKDDRLNLIVRTGSSSTLYNSLILTFGGLTIGLELFQFSIQEIHQMFNSKILNSNLRFKTIDKYLSGEFFYLKLIDRTWRRVHIPEGEIRPQPRIFHEVCAINNHAYIFGGLVLNHPKLEFVPTNDLWELNLQTSKWTLLHDGSDWQFDLSVPQPRFNHKMTTINSLTFVNKRDHFGIFIAGGKDGSSQPIYDNYVFDLVDKKYVGNEPVHLKVTTGNSEKDALHNLDDISNVDENHDLNVNYLTSIIVSIDEDTKDSSHHHHHHHTHHHNRHHSQTQTQTQTQTHKDAQDSNVLEGTPNLSNFEDEDTETGGYNKNKQHSNSHRHEPSGSIIVYTPTSQQGINPLLSFKLGKHIRNGKPLALHRKRGPQTSESILHIHEENRHSTLTESLVRKSKNVNYNIPYNLKYPTGGLFGQNLVITGFLPDDNDISIFIFNIPTGKWSRLNIFCNHDYGSHRFWGGFAWQSHHKVVLIGNYLSSKTTSSIRFYTLMITVSLPVTNILASSELAYGHHNCEVKKLAADISELKATGIPVPDSKNPTESDSSSSGIVDKITDDDESSSIVSDERLEGISSSGEKESDNSGPLDAPISFSEYVHYAAPKTTTSRIRSVFPPAAITLGRNALDRYGDLISDFEMVSYTGDRIPVSLTILIERWGRYFIQLLAKGYVQAVDKFDLDMAKDSSNSKLRTSKTSFSSNSSFSSAKLKSSIGAMSASSISSEGGSSDDHSHKINTKSRAHNDIKMTKKEQLPKEKPLYHLTMPVMTAKQPIKEVPKFRLPFQESSESSTKEKLEVPSLQDPKSSTSTTILPEQGNSLTPTDLPPIRRGSTSSFISNTSSLLTSHLQDIPPQLPLPQEQVPDVPTTPVSFKSPWRSSNAGAHDSPRASLLHTLTALRNIPSSRSPRESPYTSPRASVSAQGGANYQHHVDISNTPIPNLRPGGRAKSIDGSLNDFAMRGMTQAIADFDTTGKRKYSASYSSLPTVEDRDKKFTPLSPALSEAHSTTSSRRESTGDYGNDDEQHDSDIIDYNSDEDDNMFGNLLLNFENIEIGKFRMEPSLIPRKLYVPFSTITLKAFSEYLYTGQVGNKWLLTPTAVDNMAIARFFNVPLLYDLISEVFFGIIGRKEAHVIKEGKKLKKKYIRLHEMTDTPIPSDFNFPLDSYEGFLDTVDDGYLDLALLKNTSRIHKNSSVSVTSSRNKRSFGSSFSYKASMTDTPVEEEEPDYENSTQHLNDDVGRTEAKDSSAQSDKVEPVSPKNKTEYENVKLNPKDSGAESLKDESTDKFTSTSEEDSDFGLGFLRNNEFDSPMTNPRVKSVFDKTSYALNAMAQGTAYENEELEKDKDEDEGIQGLTLELLVSPDSPIPSDSAIDAIYEIASIVTDLKLMLRSSNARQMNSILNQTKAELEGAINSLQEKYDLQKEEAMSRQVSTNCGSEVSSIYSEFQRTNSGTSIASGLKKQLSSNDLSNKSRTMGFTRLTPFSFKGSKTEVKTATSELDKQLSKLKKRNEKELAKSEKAEKMRLEKQAKASKLERLKTDKKQSKIDKITHTSVSKVPTKLGLSKSQTDLDNTSIFSNMTRSSITRKHHTFFHVGHRKKEYSKMMDDDESVDSRLVQSPSNNGSINSQSSKHSSSTGSTSTSKKRGIFGLKRKTP